MWPVALWPLCVTPFLTLRDVVSRQLSPLTAMPALCEEQPLDLGAASSVGETGNNLCL